MGLFDFRTRRRSAEDAAQEKGKDKAKAGRVTSPGVDFVSSKELAMRIATVFRCLDILSKGVAQLPLRILRNEGGYFVEDVDDIFNLYYKLRWRPNSRMNAFDLMRSAIIQTHLQGNAYIYPRLGPDGYYELCLLAPNSVTYLPLNNYYVVSDVINGVVGSFPAEQIIHIRNIGIDGGYIGIPTLRYAANVLAISYNADKLNVEDFKGGGIMHGYVSGKGSSVGFGTVQDSQLDSVAKRIRESLDAGETIFSLPGEMQFSQLSLSPKDIELLATKTFNVLEICRFFGVHPDKVFAQQTENYKASEMSQVSFLTDTLQPYLTQIEMEYQIKLIPKSMMEQYRIKFDLEPLMQTDLSTRSDYLTKMLATGAYTVNDIRRMTGHGPVPGGDTPLVSANLLPLDSPKLRGEATQTTE